MDRKCTGRILLQHNSTLYISVPSELKWFLKKLGVKITHNMEVNIRVRRGKRCITLLINIPLSSRSQDVQNVVEN